MRIGYKITIVTRYKMERFFSWVIEMIKKYDLDGSKQVVPPLAVTHLYSNLGKIYAPKLTKVQKARLDKRIALEKKELRKHFKEHKWDLRADLLVSEVITQSLGDLDLYVTRKLLMGAKFNYDIRNKLFTLEKTNAEKRRLDKARRI